MPETHHNKTTKPAIILGAGGHARVLISLLKRIDHPITALLDDDPNKLGTTIDDIKVAGNLDAIDDKQTNSIQLVNAIGSARLPTIRQAVYHRMTTRGFTFATLLHPAAVVASQANVALGAQIMAGAVVQAHATLGANCLINTAATIDHDSAIGEHTHVAPGATICGGVTIGPGCHIGAGATVIQGIRIAANAVIGAGATVIADVPEGAVFVGTPARPM